MLTCDWAPGLMTTGLPILFQPWLVWYKSTCSNISCWTVDPCWPRSFYWGPQRENLERHPTLMAAQESTTAKFSLITHGVHYPPKKPWLLVLPIAFPSTCSWTSHKMSFAVLPVSDCVSTPFALRPQHGAPPPPLPVICAKLMMMSRMNSMLFSCIHPHTVNRRRNESLFLEARAQFLPFCTRTTTNSNFFCMNEQASSTLWLKAFPCKPFPVTL